MRDKEEEEAMVIEQQQQARARHEFTRQALQQKVQRSRTIAGDSARPSPYRQMMSDNLLSRAKSYPTVRTSPPITEDVSATGAFTLSTLRLDRQKHTRVLPSISIDISTCT